MISDLFKQTDILKINYLQPFGLMIQAKKQLAILEVLNGSTLRELTKSFRLVVLRGFLPLAKENLVQYAKTMGPLLEWDFGHVMEMRVHEKPVNYLFTHDQVPFHWDGAFHIVPKFLLFHCIEAPSQEAGGETLFTDTTKLLRDASDQEKAAWGQYQFTYKTEKRAHYGGEIKVDLIQTHPDTKDPILRFAEPVPDTQLNPVSVKMHGLEQQLTDEFINDMAVRCYQSSVCYEHEWHENDLLLADNHALLHARRAFREFSPRHLRRIQIC